MGVLEVLDHPPLAFAGLALLLLFAWLAWAPLERWPLRHIPGPWTLPFLGNIIQVATRDLTLYCHELSLKYGPVVQVWFGARPWVVVADPTAIRKLSYKSAARHPSTSSFSHMLADEAREVDAEMLLWVRGAPWKAGRRAFESSIMHPARLAGHVPAIRRCIDRFLESHLKRWADSGEALEMKKAFGVLSLAIVGEVAYGVDFWPEDEGGGEGATGRRKEGADKALVAELLHACQESFDCLEMDNATVYLLLQLVLPGLQPLWEWLAAHFPDPAQRRHMRARNKIAEVSRKLMSQWLAARAAAAAGDGNGHANGQPNGHAAPADSGFRETASGGISSSSFLAAMLEDRLLLQQEKQQQQEQRDGGGNKGAGANPETELQRMSDAQVIAQALTFMMAGYDTTSTTLATLVFLLASNPAAQDKLRYELSAHPGCLDDADRLGQLPYLDAVVKEAQRMYPAGSMVVRDVTADTDLGSGVVIPRGTRVFGSIYTVQNDPQQWRQPERFLPERFLPETKGALGPADPNAFIPFGIGPRMCVGYKLATLSVKASLAALLLRYRVALHPRQRLPLRLKTGLTMTPKDGVWVTLAEI